MQVAEPEPEPVVTVVDPDAYSKFTGGFVGVHGSLDTFHGGLVTHLGGLPLGEPVPVPRSVA